jgi:membrane-bound ClpP family serine protease
MTYKDCRKYLEGQQRIQYETKALVLSIYWKIRKANWIRNAGIGSILLSLQILSSSFSLHSLKLGMVSIVFLLIGLYLRR